MPAWESCEAGLFLPCSWFSLACLFVLHVMPSPSTSLTQHLKLQSNTGEAVWFSITTLRLNGRTWSVSATDE